LGLLITHSFFAFFHHFSFFFTRNYLFLPFLHALC
jgi:hypothetical protein